ncbi:nucleotide sugar dehydrogenase, partial [bacterium M00.F.Ca.ET.222.01.1.1]
DDFTLGYSPERANPGDREHSLQRIVKVVSGENTETLERVADTYGRIIDAGVYRAPSIKVAEAAKVIENTQRDLNIALMNELAMIFERLDIRTQDVLDAASTKWNFLPFKPDFVGGHCIS